MNKQLYLNTMSSTDGDTKNLIISYYLNKRQKFTEEEKEYIIKHKNDFLTMEEGINKGVPILFCINAEPPKFDFIQGTYYNKNISMLKGPGDVRKGIFKNK